MSEHFVVTVMAKKVDKIVQYPPASNSGAGPKTISREIEDVFEFSVRGATVDAAIARAHMMLDANKDELPESQHA